MVQLVYMLHMQLRALLIPGIDNNDSNSSGAQQKQPRHKDALQIIQLYGDQARVQALLIMLNEDEPVSKQNSQLFVQLLTELVMRPASCLVVLQKVLENSQKDLASIIARTKLPPTVQLCFALAALQHPTVMPAINDQGLDLLHSLLTQNLLFTDDKPEWLARHLVTLSKSSKLVNDRALLLETLRTNFPSLQYDMPLPSQSSFNSTVQSLQELGYDVMLSADVFKNALSSFPPLTENDVAQIICMMLQSLQPSSANTFGWSPEVFTNVLRMSYPRLSWTEVFAHLDRPEFQITDAHCFAFLVIIWQNATNNLAFPLEICFRDWMNSDGQLSLLRFLLPSCATIFTFFDLPKSSSGDAMGQPTAAIGIVTGAADAVQVTHGFASIDFLDALLELQKQQLYRDIKQLLKAAVAAVPELLVSGMLTQASSTSQKQDDALLLLLPCHFAITPTSIAASSLQQFFTSNHKLVLYWMSQLYLRDRAFASRLIDYGQELIGLLSCLSERRPVSIVLELGPLTDRREPVKLEHWLRIRLHEYGSAFALAILQYLDDNINGQGTAANGVYGHINGSVSQSETHSSDLITPEVVVIFMRAILAYQQNLPLPAQERLGDVYGAYVAQSPTFLKLLSELTTADDVEEEANLYFQKVYTGQISLDELIQLISRFRTSGVRREIDLYACMLFNLFDEYRFFHKYPLRELGITAELFGKLIQHRLLQSFTLHIALRFLLEGARQATDSKLFQFAAWTYPLCEARLLELPHYSALLVQIQPLRTVLPEFIARLQSSLNAAEKQDGVVQTGVAALSRLFASLGDGSKALPPALLGPETAPDIAVDYVIAEEPSDSIKDKIHFIMNGVSKGNVKQKTHELRELLKPEWYSFFAHYLVIKRVSLESNFQKLYAFFLETLGVHEIRKAVLASTYENICALLSSDKILTSTNERSLLRNLGSWLGLLTLACNKPVLARYINIKELILAAYTEGRLIAIIPFCAKVIESAAESRVFRLPNPWLSTILQLLKEIFELPGLKLNLKFEIEVLFSNLQVDMRTVTKSNILKDRVARPNTTFAPPTPVKDAKRSELRSPSPTAAAEEEHSSLVGPPGQSSKLPSAALQILASAFTSGASADQTSVQLSSYVIFASTGFFQTHPQLKRLVTSSIERAIREIISPVVERSVTIACVTTRELILKDFALEPDENKMRQAAHYMVSNLTSSLALVTCREPLRLSINNHLQQLLQEANVAQQLLSTDRLTIESACLQASQDNLELGCQVIEKAAQDRAVKEIDEALGSSYTLRRQHREKTGQPYMDMSIYQTGSRYPAALPEPLRPKPGGLLPSQLRVYEDFQRIRQLYAHISQQTNSKDAVTVTGGAPMASSQLPSSSENRRGSIHSSPPPSAVAGQQARSSTGRSPPSGPQLHSAALEKLLGLMGTLEAAVLRIPNHKGMPLHSLSLQAATRPGDEHEINALLRMLQALLNSIPRDDPAVHRDFLLLTFAHKVFKRLYDRDNRTSLLQIDVHISVLKCIRSACPSLVHELTGWLIHGDDDRKFMLPITAGMLRARLLQTVDVDIFLGKLATSMLQSGAQIQVATPYPPNAASNSQTQITLHPHLEFILALIRRVVVKRPIVSVAELGSTLEVLNSLQQGARHKIVADAISHLLDEIRLSQLLLEREREREAETVAMLKEMGITSSQPPIPPGGTVPPLYDPLDSARLDFSKLQLDDEPDAIDIISDEPEAPILRQQSVYLLDEWMNICLQGNASDKAYAQFLQLLQQQRVLATSDQTSRFFRIIVHFAVENALQTHDVAVHAIEPTNTLSYTAVDALAKLFVFLLKFYEAPTGNNLPGSIMTHGKIRLLSLFLLAIANVLRKNAQVQQHEFNCRPYLRLFCNLLFDLNTPDPLLDSNNADVLLVFAHSFHLLRPQLVPSFGFAWLELITHRMFMPKLLLNHQHNTNVLFARLVVDLLVFLQPYLRLCQLDPPIRLMYKATLRVFLVLLHDFPEFLCDFHLAFMDYIPHTCIQLRNLILSAFPRNMRLPDPFTPNLKVDMLPEIQQPPRMLADTTKMLQQPSLRAALLQPLDSFLKTREPANIMPQLVRFLRFTTHPTADSSNVDSQVDKNGLEYNTQLINALIMYIAMQGLQSLKSHQAGKVPPGMLATTVTLSNGATVIVEPGCMDVFLGLLEALDAEGRYLVINGMCNQLRFPNTHTHYFSCTLLWIFLHSNKDDESIREIITRVLLERLIVHRPHPWGLLVTFIELIKNARYTFWQQQFVTSQPEIQRLFRKRLTYADKYSRVFGTICWAYLSALRMQTAEPGSRVLQDDHTNS